MRYKFKTAFVLSCVLWAFAVVRGATHSELGLMPKHLKHADKRAKEEREQRNTTFDEAALSAATTTKTQRAERFNARQAAAAPWWKKYWKT